MAEPEVEAAWRAEFERSGVTQTRDALSVGGFTDEKRQAAFRWLGDEAEAQRLQQQPACCQRQVLQLKPWQLPPCRIRDPDHPDRCRDRRYGETTRSCGGRGVIGH